MFDLREQLANTGLYSESDPISRGELKAYERQLNDFLAWQQQMKREFALDTTELLLPRWEKIYAVTPLSNDSVRDRQLRLLNKRRAKGVLTPAKVVALAADLGYEAKVVKRVRPFRYRVEVPNVAVIDFGKLDQVLDTSEPGHQAHEFGVTQNTGIVEYISETSDPLVYVSTYRECGTIDCGGDLGL